MAPGKVKTAPTIPCSSRVDENNNPLRTIDALILLCGSIRPTPLIRSIGRSVMDLPLTADKSLMRHWYELATELSCGLDMPKLDTRVLFNNHVAPPSIVGMNGRVHLQMDQDRCELRGTAGVLRDVAEPYPEDSLFLIAHGAQHIRRPLTPIVQQMIAKEADVVLLVEPDHSPSGLMLMQRSALNVVSKIGYVDLKEQALPRMRQHCKVEVLFLDEPLALPIRCRESYLHALHQYYHDLMGDGQVLHPFSEKWQATFRIVEGGTQVAPDARILNSVVLSGGTVESGAVVVDSVVGPGGVVRRGTQVLGQLIRAPQHKKMRGVS